MKLGNLDISTVKLGANQVQAVYQGDNLVWQNAPVATAATGVGQTSFTANWNAYTGATYYLLDVSESSNFSTFVYENQQVNAPSTSYVVVGLDPNTTYYYRVRASDDDADVAAFFNRVTTAGGTLSTTEQEAVNTLVEQMKADGIWTKMKAIYPMVGASAAACAQNLKSSSFTGTFNGGWTFASTGATPNGSNGYFSLNFNATNLSNDSTSWGVYNRSNSTIASKHDFGGIPSPSGSFTLCALNYTSVGTATRTASSNRVDIAFPSDIRGFYNGNRNNSSNFNLFKNGSKTGTTNESSGTVNSVDWILGALNNNGSIADYSNREYSLCFTSNGLTDTEASNLYTAVQAFQTTLSRQV